MSASEWGEAIVWTILIGLLLWGYLEAASWVGRKLHAADLRAQERQRIRLRALVDLADAYDAAETDKQRSLIYRKATDLGFTEGAFQLDDYEQPHPPRNAA